MFYNMELVDTVSSTHKYVENGLETSSMGFSIQRTFCGLCYYAKGHTLIASCSTGLPEKAHHLELGIQLRSDNYITLESNAYTNVYGKGLYVAGSGSSHFSLGGALYINAPGGLYVNGVKRF
jgi:hypothetical protein